MGQAHWSSCDMTGGGVSKLVRLWKDERENERFQKSNKHTSENAWSASLTIAPRSFLIQFTSGCSQSKQQIKIRISRWPDEMADTRLNIVRSSRSNWADEFRTVCDELYW